MLDDIEIGSEVATPSTKDKVVTPYHVRWLELSESEQIPSQVALDHVHAVLTGKYKHQRTGRFSPSGLGGCMRRSLFSFGGAPQVPFDTQSAELMGHGSWDHLRWQWIHLTTGLFTAAELYLRSASLLLSGSIDALLYTGGIFELKTLHGFKHIKMLKEGTGDAYDQQEHAYMLLGDENGIDHGDQVHLVIEDRSSGQFQEFIHKRSSASERVLLGTLKTLRTHVNNNDLPPMLDGCDRATGDVFRRCPYRQHCPRALHVFPGAT